MHAMQCYSASGMRDCNTAVNDAIRKVFKFNRWESIRTLRECFGLKSSYEIFANTRIKFLENIAHHHISLLREIRNNLVVTSS